MAAVHPLSSFTELNLADTDPGTVLNTSVPPLDDVPGLFRRLRTDGDLLSASDSGVFTGDRTFRYTDLNQQGLNAGINHLQGIARLGRGRYLALSGGDSTDAIAHLFVVRMDSRAPHGPWGSNLLQAGRPQETDGLVRVVALARGMWHAGGLALLGDVLAIPLEGNGQSRVIFLHVADPQNPTRLPVTIDRPRFSKAGAAALSQLPDGRYLCVVWREDGSTAPVGRLDFYLSHGSDLRAGFEERGTFEFPGLGPSENRDPQYQAITLLSPVRDPAAGGVRLDMIGTENTSGMAPIGKGANIADLFTLALPDGFLDSSTGSPSLKWVAPAGRFHAPREYCNFDSAAGLYLDASGSSPSLHLYAAYHWRVNRTIRMAEFAGTPGHNVVAVLNEGWIELYEHDGFRGRRLTIYGDRDSLLEDYSRIVVQDGDFDRSVSSIRWQLPVGCVYRLYRRPRFVGVKAGHDFTNLVGTGSVESIADLQARKFGDTVASSCFVARTS